MSSISTSSLDLFSGKPVDDHGITQHHDQPQHTNDFSEKWLTPEEHRARTVPHLGSPYQEDPEAPQASGWASPSYSESGEEHQEMSPFAALYFGPSAESLPASTPVENPATENARLRAEIAAMSERLIQLESAVAPKTPSQHQPVRLPTTPSKRCTSSVNDRTVPPSEKASPMTPQSMGPIEAMWGPGVTPEQRRAIYKSQVEASASPVARMSSPSSAMGRRTLKSTAASILPAASKPKRSAVTKKSRAPRAKKAATPKKAPTPKARPASELSELNFLSLPAEEKASILFPTLEGIDPFTGQLFSPIDLGLNEGFQAGPSNFMFPEDNATTTPSTPKTTGNGMTMQLTMPTEDDTTFTSTFMSTGDDDMTAVDFEALFNYTAGNDNTFDFGHFTMLESVDGAARQREALAQHEQRVAEGRRR